MVQCEKYDKVLKECQRWLNSLRGEIYKKKPSNGGASWLLKLVSMVINPWPRQSSFCKVCTT